jgi:hypothetical protein
MKTVKKFLLVSLIIGSVFTSVRFTQANNAFTNQTLFYLGDKVSAGPDALLGLNPLFITQGTTNISGFIVWTTSGDGVFDNPFCLNSSYAPGVQDINQGHVTLIISIIPHGMNHRSKSDSMLLTF